MQTDQIQKILHERSDKATEADVKAALSVLRQWIAKRAPYPATVDIPVAAGQLRTRDGLAMLGAGSSAASALPEGEHRERVRLGHLRVKLSELPGLLEGAMIDAVTPADRVASVKAFVAQVDSAAAQVEELRSIVDQLPQS